MCLTIKIIWLLIFPRLQLDNQKLHTSIFLLSISTSKDDIFICLHFNEVLNNSISKIFTLFLLAFYEFTFEAKSPQYIIFTFSITIKEKLILH